MIRFTEWLNEIQSNIKFTKWSNDGSISVIVNGIRYEYMTDPLYHARWKNLAKYTPGKVFNSIVQQVKLGKAKKLSPYKCDSCNKCPNCGTPEPSFRFGLECPGCGEKIDKN